MKEKLNWIFCINDASEWSFERTTTADSKMTILSNGNVGIGTTEPGAELNVKGSDSAADKECQLLIETGNYNKGIEFRYVDLDGSAGGSNYPYNFPQAKIYTSSSTAYMTKLHFSTAKGNWSNRVDTSNTTAVEVMTLDHNGYVGIGTTSPSYPLEVNGSVSEGSVNKYFSSTVNWLNSGGGNSISIRASNFVRCDGLIHDSDERIKENITDIDDNYSLQKVRDISCVWYNYKDKVSREDVRVAGFIAQQVKEHLPEAVRLEREIIPNEMRLIDVSWNGIDMSCNLQDVSGVKYRFYVTNDISGNDTKKKDVIVMQIIHLHLIINGITYFVTEKKLMIFIL